jgi:hypothetical protein
MSKSDYAIGWATEELWFHSQQGQEIYLFSISSRKALGLT